MDSDTRTISPASSAYKALSQPKQDQLEDILHRLRGRMHDSYSENKTYSVSFGRYEKIIAKYY